MTTIVYDGKTLAVDSQLTQGSTICGLSNKIQDVGKYWFAGCGTTDGIEAVKLYLMGVIPKPENLTDNDADITLIEKETGKAFRVLGDTMVICPVEIPVFQGSGADVARGAYQICKDPIKALEVAIELDVFTGGPINTIEIQKPA